MNLRNGVWRFLLVSFVLLSLFGAGWLGLSISLPGRSSRETLEESLGPLLDRPHTKFAPGFREDRFRSLPLGCTESQVLRALGPPLGTRFCPDQMICWDYSGAAASDASYFPRVLVFDDSRRLVHRHMGFVLGD
jgi:hypothetical protein